MKSIYSASDRTEIDGLSIGMRTAQKAFVRLTETAVDPRCWGAKDGAGSAPCGALGVSGPPRIGECSRQGRTAWPSRRLASLYATSY